MEAERMFPVLWSLYHVDETARWEALGCPRSVPWSLLAPHEAQALANHDQTLERLAQRGGLSPFEMVLVIEDKRLYMPAKGADEASIPRLLAHLKKFYAAAPPDLGAGERRTPILCDGCRVRGAWEHRCHGRLARVNDERALGPCECGDCNTVTPSPSNPVPGEGHDKETK